MGKLWRGLLCAWGVVLAPSVATADGFEKGPYLQNVTQTSVTVMWENAGEVPGTVTVHAGSDLRIASGSAEIHEVVVSGLEPGKRYRYRVESGDETSTGEFATAPRPGEPFSFIVFGDSRSNPGSHRNVVERIRGEVPDFILGTGDMVNEGGKEADWRKFFEVEQDLLRENVLFPSLGNHDRQGRGRTADNYRRYFSLPENSPDPERYYAFTYGSARFLILDSNLYSFALTDQTAWIEQQLQAARLDKNIHHIFVSMHHPPFSVSLHGGQSQLREAWTPLFEKFQVAAVFSGHDHVYSRSYRNGVHYFVSGGGGAPLYPRKKKASRIDEAALRYFERTNHYLRVHVVGDFIEITMVRHDGTVAETVAWGKHPELSPEQLQSLTKPAEPMQSAPKTIDMPASGGPAPATVERAGFGTRGIVGIIMTLCAALTMLVVGGTGSRRTKRHQVEHSEAPGHQAGPR